MLVIILLALFGNALSAFTIQPLRIFCRKHDTRAHQVHDEAHIPCDLLLRDEAARALLPVLFPLHNKTASSKIITAEAALKKMLRSRYQSVRNVMQSSHTDSTTLDSGRLASLVLGTSVMRLRHWYRVANAREMVPPIPYPLDPSIASLLQDCIACSTDASNVHHAEDELLSFTKAMVDEHIQYLSNPEQQGLAERSNSVHSDEAISLSIDYSVPIFLTEALLKHYDHSTIEEVFKQSNAPGPITIRKNSIKYTGSDEELCQYFMDVDGVEALPLRSTDHSSNVQFQKKPKIQLSSEGTNRLIVSSDTKAGTIQAPLGCIQIKQLPKSIWSMKTWQDGSFEVQDAGSQIIVASLEAEPGNAILDYCAGNGGKTFSVASALMARSREGFGSSVSSVVAHDVVEERLRQIKGSMSRVGLTEEVNSDMAKFSTSNFDGHSCKIIIATTTELEAINYKFDIVLVDAPCSSAGVLRRRPSQRWSITEEEVFQTLPKLQLEILLKAAALVKSGGKLVYSTCSLLKEENEDVAAAFERSDVFRGSFERWYFDSNSDRYEHHSLTLLPSDKSDGFFIARWKAF